MRVRKVRKIEDIANGDLYALLAVCTKEDLDPLVALIKGKISNFLEINEDYKKHSPDHTKYHNVIADEVRLFGGNTFRNLMRGGEGPPYDEIVLDICKKLEIPGRAGETVKNEGNILTIFLDRQWRALSEEEQNRLIAEARANAAKEVGVNTKNVLMGGSMLLAPRLALGPVAWGATVVSIADPAFSVTVPCVLHIAYLRQKYMEVMCPTSGLTSVAKTEPTERTLVRSSVLAIGVSENDQVLSLARISEPPVTNWNPVGGDDGISRLNPLLQAVPSLATAGEVASGKYMEVVINGPLLKAKGKEGYRLITMIDNKPSHGTLLDPSKLSNIVNASALLQVASVAVAQKHLADISKKLSDIKAIVERISKFQEDKRKSKITASIHYFEQVAKSVLSGELSASVRSQFEGHESLLLSIQAHLMVDIRHESKAILDVKDETMFGSKGMEDAIREHQKRLDDLYHQLLVCIRARACGWQLLMAYPGEDGLKVSRRDGIEEAIKVLSEGGDLLSNTDKCVFRTKPSTRSDSNPPVIPIQTGHPFRLDQVHLFRFRQGQSFRFKPATVGGLLGERELLLALAVRPHRGCSFDDDSLRASDQTVKNGVSYGRIAAAKIIVPTVHGQLTGHQSRSTSGALLNNFQQVTAAHRVERVNAKVI